MPDKARIRIAAAVTAVFLAGISAAGLAARDDEPQAATAATQPTGASSTRPTASDESAGRDDERYEAEDDRYEADEDGYEREDDE